MKRLRYIWMVLFSLLVIYSGVGMSVCKCQTCEVACFLCSTPCTSCDTAEDSDATCEDEGCEVNIYKVDLTNQETQPLVSVCSLELFCELLPDFQSVLPLAGTQIPYIIPPRLPDSRHLLALYSTLII